METKKSKKADLEHWKSIFFTFGLIITLSIVFFAFEWKSSAQKLVVFDGGVLLMDEPMVEITKRDIEKPLVKPKTTSFDFKLVDNNTFTPHEILLPENYDGLLVFDHPEVEEVVEFIEPFYKFPENPAEFIGSFEGYLKDNIVYPELAKQLNIQGIVYIYFVIDSKGRIKDVKIIRGVDPTVDEEAIRVIKKMPPWKPAVQGDRKVSTEMTLPIKFTLAN